MSDTILRIRPYYLAKVLFVLMAVSVSSCSLSDEELSKKINTLTDGGGSIIASQTNNVIYHVGTTFYKIGRYKNDIPDTLLFADKQLAYYEGAYTYQTSDKSLTVDELPVKWSQVVNYLTTDLHVDFADNNIFEYYINAENKEVIKIYIGDNEELGWKHYLYYYLDNPDSMFVYWETSPEIGVNGKTCKSIVITDVLNEQNFKISLIGIVCYGANHKDVIDYLPSTVLYETQKAFPLSLFGPQEELEQLIGQVIKEKQTLEAQREAERIRLENERIRLENERKAKEEEAIRRARANEIIECPSCNGRGYFYDAFGKRILCVVCGQRGYVRRGDVWW